VIVAANGSERKYTERVFEVDSTTRPCVGVSSGSSRDAIAALADLGYIIEVGERADGYAVHLGRVDRSDLAAVEACRRVIDESRRPVVRFGTWPDGCKSAFSVTGDIDALTIWDFVHRFRGL